MSRGVWSIVLAGGEGERTRAFVESWLGHHRPKQYCVFTGTRSLFQHTVDRADALSSPERRVVVAAREHEPIVRRELLGRGEGRVILQPQNRGTASGVFAALAAVLARDPNATVVTYPSDHFVYPEGQFMAVMKDAIRRAEELPETPVLLGVRPSGSEPDYGWIVPASGASERSPARVEAFLEKPPRPLAEVAMRKGALWNTLIVAAKAPALWALGFRSVPEIMPAFARYFRGLRAGGGDAVLSDLYPALPARDLSRDVLQQVPEQLRVLELEGVWWSDWGRPERIIETLKDLGRPAAFPEELSAEPGEGRGEPCLVSV
jgi:mannose-1-phosphate guanylyltransferase